MPKITERARIGLPSAYIHEGRLATIERQAARLVRDERSIYRAHWFLWRAGCIMARISGASTSEILQGKSTDRLVKYRRAAMWLARTAGGLSYPKMARLLGYDHSSIRESCDIFERGLTSDTIYRRLLCDVFLAEAELNVRLT